MTFNPMNFIYNLKYMGMGMLGIIIVIGVIILITMFLNKVTSGNGKQNKLNDK